MEIQGPLSDAQRDALERVTRNQRHLLALINDILNFARIEKGQITVDLGPVAVHEIVASLEALVAPQLRTKALDYVVTEVDPTLTLRTDGEKVRQILLNLLSNAAKFTPAGGRVTLTVGCDAAQVRIAVHDTGSGIPADRLDEIFEPFVQIERSLARSHEGAGLGLAISRELARALGGELAVASELGAGSTFTLVLPRR
jgi:signal transduction histidine kinase